MLAKKDPSNSTEALAPFRGSTRSELEDSQNLESNELTDLELEEISDDELEYGSVSYKVQGFDVAGLKRRLEQQQILIPRSSNNESIGEAENFQREFVWKKSQMDQFIESLLLGYPTPSIFLVEQSDNKYILMDGQQRLSTIKAFYDEKITSNTNETDKEFKLSYVTKILKGKKYSNLDESLRLKLDNTNINAIIVQSTERNDLAIHAIFQRLNSGGTPLTPHEIRVALYRGQLIRDINMVNSNDNWRKIYGRPDKRLRDHALIMKIIALDIDGQNYKNPMLSFLNNFAKLNRNGNDRIDEVIARFDKAAELLSQNGIGNRSENQIEAYFLGAMHALKIGLDLDREHVARSIALIDGNDTFAQLIKSRTTDTKAVKGRREIAERAFEKIGN